MDELTDITKALIYIVDDNPTNITVLETILQKEKYSNIRSTTDPTTVDSFLKHNDVDILILDINMPILDGFGVLRLIREKYSDRHIPVVIATAQSDTVSRIRALKLGARDCLTKPLDRTETLNRVSINLEYRLLYKNLEKKVARSTQELRNANENLLHAHRETLSRLARAAEYRDNETGNHLTRMSKYSCVIAHHLGYPPNQLDNLRFAAPMHDIGKIAVPDGILLKPGKLTPEEFDIMKTHAERGAQLLSHSQSAIIQMAQIIAQTHHEKWNGSGYPSQLSGSNIPEVGRIVAIADCFDALTSVRPYKHAWTVEDALSYMQKESGISFDPHILSVFINALPEILDIKTAYQDE